MVIETANSLVEAIRELDLLDAERLGLLVNDLAGRYPRPRDLGRHLMQTEWLTAYQVNQLLQGRGRQLILGPYVMLRRLATGGMGEVFEARHRKLHRVAALKVVSRERFDTPLARQRFLREAEAAAQLSHPNVVAVHDAGEEDGNYYLAMELVDGVDLARLMLDAGLLPVGLACDFIRQAALGLHHAHEQGLVHRDVKPQNLLAAPRGGLGKDRAAQPLERFVGSTVKVLDLGLVRLGADTPEVAGVALTQQGIVLGTLDYLAPEQARSSHHVDRRADLYSLGCTLYHLLCDRPPFPGGQPLDKLLRHQTEEATRLSAAREDVPAALESVVARLMAKRPEDRYATAADVAMALLPFCSGSLTVPLAKGPSSEEIEGCSNQSPTRVLDLAADREREIPTAMKVIPTAMKVPPTPMITPREKRPVARRKRWPWLVGAAAVLALVLLIVMGVTSDRTEERPEPKKKPEPRRVDHLAEYVPPDSVGVVSVRPGELARAAVFGEEGGQAIDGGLTELFDLMNADVKKDVDQVRTFLPRRGDEATIVMRGRFEPAKFLQGDGGFELFRTAAEGRDETFRHQPSGLLLTSRGGYLVGSKKLGRIESALEHANKGNSSPPRDADLRRLLAEVDRKPTVWFALVPGGMDEVPMVGKEAMQNATRQIVEQARTIRGGLSCGEDLTLRLVIEARSERALWELMRRLETLRGRWKGQTLGRGLPRDQRLWLTLLANLTWTRQGERVEVASVVKGASLRD